MFRTLVGPVSLLALLMAGLYTVSAQDNAYKPAPIPRETAEPPGAAPSPLVVPPGPSPVPAPSVEQMLQRLAQPAKVKSVKIGQTVTVERAKISDWMYIENRKLVGGYTLRALRETLPPDERANFDKSVPFVID